MHQRQGLEGNLGQQLGEDPRDCLGEQGPQAAFWGVIRVTKTLKTLIERDIYIDMIQVEHLGTLVQLHFSAMMCDLVWV